jgi:hypothetical protein
MHIENYETGRGSTVLRFKKYKSPSLWGNSGQTLNTMVPKAKPKATDLKKV